MKIVVLSDTHIKGEVDWLSPELKKIFQKIGFIIHCGDFVIPYVYQELSKLGKVIAVHGNMDAFELKEELPPKITFQIERKKIGIIHGFGSPYGLEARVGTALPGVDVVLYGHSHRPQNIILNDVLFFNPGSLTNNRFTPFNSYGIIELDSRGVKGEIIKI